MPDTTEFETVLRDWIIENGDDPTSLSEMEQTLRRLLQRIGGLLLSLWSMWVSRGYRDRKVRCPHCEEQATYVRQRRGSLRTMFGRADYKRALYQCQEYGNWHYAMDEAPGLRPNAMSAEVERLAAQVGVHVPFAQASQLFEELTLVSVSDQSVDKATRAYGQASMEREQAQLAQAQAGQTATVAPLRLYGSIDGGRVRTRAPQGEVQPWREVKTCAWYKREVFHPPNRMTSGPFKPMTLATTPIFVHRRTLVIYSGQVVWHESRKKPQN